MANKRKSPVKESTNDSADSGPSIFKTLFGNISEEGTSVSLFSDDNPFRRKPTSIETTQQPKQPPPPPAQQQQQQEPESGSGSVSAEANQYSTTINGDSGEPKKRKRKKEENYGLDSDLIGQDSQIRMEVKKSKRVEPVKANPSVKIGSGEGEKGKYSSLSSKGRENGKYLSFESKETLSNEKEDLNLAEGKGKEKGRKKRKRDEIEAEYEARRYGAPMVEDGGEHQLGGKVVFGEKRKKMDNPEDMMVSNEGFDDEPKLLRTVFVGNLPLKVKKKLLLKEFGQFGEVESVRIRSVPIAEETKLPRKTAIIKKKINDSADSVHAYIVFKTEESAQASLSHNMAVVGGNHIRVDRACPPRKKLKGDSDPLYDNRRTVFVGNLPYDVKDEEIYQLFCGINNLESSIEAVRVVRDPNSSAGKGIAYVLFKTRDAVNSVLKKHNLKLRDRELRLSHAKSNATPSKRRLVPAEADYSPAKKLAVDARTPDGNRFKAKASMSYQGMRASKSGNQKKFHPKTSGPVEIKSKSQKGLKPKERTMKRPAVAARKARLIGAVSKQAGSKRKMESTTPDSARRNKKPRRSK